MPATCDHPDCNEKIDRGLSYVCGDEPFGGERGCGLFFCSKHLAGSPQRCEKCLKRRKPFLAKPDHPEWIAWKLNDESWQEWRDENPEDVKKMQEHLSAICSRASLGEQG